MSYGLRMSRDNAGALNSVLGEQSFDWIFQNVERKWHRLWSSVVPLVVATSMTQGQIPSLIFQVWFVLRTHRFLFLYIIL
jgi:hypothetical protein